MKKIHYDVLFLLHHDQINHWYMFVFEFMSKFYIKLNSGHNKQVYEQSTVLLSILPHLKTATL